MLEPHLDDSVVRTLIDIMLDGFPGLLAVFAGDAEGRLAELNASLAQRDSESVKRLAHSFKGSSCNMGAVRLAALCRELELSASERQLADADALLEAIRGEFQLVQRLIADSPRRLGMPGE